MDNFTAWRRNENLASLEDGDAWNCLARVVATCPSASLIPQPSSDPGLKHLPWTLTKGCYRLNLSIKSYFAEATSTF